MDEHPLDELSQLRLYVEEICCDLCRLRHLHEGGAPPEAVRITRAADLGAGRYADVRVEAPGIPSYFLEVGYGLAPDRLLERVRARFGAKSAAAEEALRLVLVVERSDADFLAQVRRELGPGVELEIWDEPRLCAMIGTHFGVKLDSVRESDPHELRASLDDWKWRRSFGDDDADGSLRSALLWHFGFWRLRAFHEAQKREATAILPPGEYGRVVVLMADLCSFSAYVRDTPSHEVVAHCMTNFYSRTSHQVHDWGGMLLEFVGDSVLALFGVPDRAGDEAERALRCARTLVSVGNALAEEWQSRIDRLQDKRGVRIGMSVGDLRVISQRAFSRTHIGTLGDAINLAARLNAAGEPGRIVVSNALYAELPAALRDDFTELPPLGAKNMGMIKAWQTAARGA